MRNFGQPTTVDGIKAIRMSASTDTFSFNNSISSSCYLQDRSGLSPGAMDLGPCAEGAPMVASFPHFLHADQRWTDKKNVGGNISINTFFDCSYLSSVSGVTAPSPSLHEMFLTVEPTLGIPVQAQVRFQLSLALRRDAAFPPLSQLRLDEDEVLVMPLLWVQEGFDSLGGARAAALAMALAAPKIAGGAVLVLLFLPGSSFEILG